MLLNNQHDYVQSAIQWYRIMCFSTPEYFEINITQIIIKQDNLSSASWWIAMKQNETSCTEYFIESMCINYMFVYYNDLHP